VTSLPISKIEKLLTTARRLAGFGDFKQAADLYERLLELPITDSLRAEVLESLALVEISAKNLRRAEALLHQALLLNADSSRLHTHLGVLFNSENKLGLALEALSRAISCDPTAELPHLYRGSVHEKLGEKYQALGSYFRAIAHAQSRGAWLDPKSIPRGLRDLVGHAMDYIQ